MIEDTTMIELTEKKPIKRRIVVTAMLALAAMGAHHLHGRTIPRIEPELVRSNAINSEDTAKPMVGPNSLLGDVCADQKFSAPIAVDLSVNELDLSSITDHACIAGNTDPSLDGLDSGSLKEFDAASGVPSEANLSAVPEPSTAGLLLLAAAPVVGFRRPRHRNTAIKS